MLSKKKDHGDSHGSRTRHWQLEANLRLRAEESGWCEPRAVTVVEIRMPSLPVRMHLQVKGNSERALQLPLKLEADRALDSEAEIC